jgi:hypothetical protein
MRLGSEIVAGLYEYQEANGSFPRSLSLLAPAFIDEIPVTHNSEEFFYNPDIEGFILSFLVTRNFGCGYSASHAEWECGHGDE